MTHTHTHTHIHTHMYLPVCEETLLGALKDEEHPRQGFNVFQYVDVGKDNVSDVLG